MADAIIDGTGNAYHLKVQADGSILTNSFDNFTQQIAYSGNVPQYHGYKLPESATAGSVWAIRKIEYSGNFAIDIKWASGGSGWTSFDKVWADRASYTYE